MKKITKPYGNRIQVEPPQNTYRTSTGRLWLVVEDEEYSPEPIKVKVLAVGDELDYPADISTIQIGDEVLIEKGAIYEAAPGIYFANGLDIMLVY